MDFYFREDHPKGDHPEAQLDKVSRVIGMLTFYVFIIPVILHGIFFFFGSGSPGYQKILAVYGYSYTIFIPAAVLLVVPLEYLKYIILAVACFTSLFHISKELMEAGQRYLDDKVLKIMAIL